MGATFLSSDVPPRFRYLFQTLVLLTVAGSFVVYCLERERIARRPTVRLAPSLQHRAGAFNCGETQRCISHCD
jgi:hypothetical protein